MRFALLLLLAGCAGNQSAFPMPPAAPSFSPTLDAPITVGQPGYAGSPENMPRSPHGRELPQTPETRREDGIWAAKPPSLPPLPTIVGVTIPIPAGDDMLDYVVALAKCAATSDEALRQIGAGGHTVHQYAMQRQPEAQRKCLAAKLLASCARAAQSQSRSQDPRAPERMSVESTDALATYTKALLERWCEGVDLDPTLAKAHRHIEKSVFPRLETQ